VHQVGDQPRLYYDALSTNHQDMKSWLRGNVTGLFGVLSVFDRIIPLMPRSNTDTTPNKPVTLPRNQLLIRYAVTSPVHNVTIRCYDTR